MHRGFRPRAASLLVLCLLLAGCDESERKGSARRSEAVLAAPGQNQPQAEEERTELVGAPAGKQARAGLCDQKPNRPLSRARLGGRGAGLESFRGGIPAAAGLTWVSLWAAWCEPCKKEIPFLLATEKRLRALGLDFRVEFVSIDDDERQLTQFLANGPKGFTKTFWLEEGKERESWLSGAGLPADPRLPVQLLVDTAGTIVCRVDGSVDESDAPLIEQTLNALR